MTTVSEQSRPAVPVASVPAQVVVRPAKLQRQVILLVLLYSLSFSYLSSALRLQHGFPLDDSYIHQTIARNLAEHATLGFITGQRSSGATSLLWTILQAGNYRVLGGIDPVWYNLGFSYLCFAAIGPLLFLLAKRDGLSRRTCWVMAATPALMGNFLWLGLIGMEHLLFVVLSLAAIYWWFTPAPKSRWTAVLTSCAAGLLVITRPEATVFAPLLVIVSYAAKVRRNGRDLSILLGLWALMLGLFFGANLWTSGSLMPVTLKGRSWLYFHRSGGAHSVHSMVRFCGAWIQRLPRQFSVRYTHQMDSVNDIRAGAAIFGIGLVALALLGAWTLLKRRPLRMTMLLIWATLHFTIYLFTFPSGGHGGRYQPLTLMLFFPLLFLGLHTVLTTVFHTRRVWVFAVVCAVVAVAGAASLRTWKLVTLVGIRHINDTHGKIALYMRDHVPVTARFAAFDIGRVSFDWGGQVIDLGGLVDPTYFHYLAEGRVPEYLQMRQVQYVLLPSMGMEAVGFDSMGTAQKLVEFCSPAEDWLIGFRYTIHATQCQELYQLAAPLIAGPAAQGRSH